MLTRDLATVDQRWEDIEQHAQEALAIAERLGSPVWSARIQADLAEALDLRARAGDGARAATLWCAALAEAERLGCRGSCSAAARVWTDRNRVSPRPPRPRRRSW